MAVRYSPPYRTAVLLEINSHSLFSKFFSESGKLVQKMFAKIRDYVDDENVLAVIIIDEVESLTAARSQSSSEPSDAIREGFGPGEFFTFNLQFSFQRDLTDFF